MSQFRCGNADIREVTHAAMFEIARGRKHVAIQPAKHDEDHTRLIIGDEITDEEFSLMLDTDTSLVDAINDCVMFNHGWDRVLDLINPESAAVVDETFNNLPIHYACANAAPASVINMLLDAHPSGARERDWQGKLPLHMALDNEYVDVDAVKSLLEAFPQGAKAKDDNDQIPLHSAMKKKVTADILILLTLADLPIAADGHCISDHEYSWASVLDSEEVSIETSICLVEAIFAQLPELAAELVHSKDRRGREVIDFVRPEVRRLINEHLFVFGRYDIVKGPPVHYSATSIVYFADDYGVYPTTRVVLKFMRNLDQVNFLTNMCKGKRDRNGAPSTQIG